MEEEISEVRNFLKEFNNEQSPTSEEATRIGNYPLDSEDVTGHVIDWVINYLDNRLVCFLFETFCSINFVYDYLFYGYKHRSIIFC